MVRAGAIAGLLAVTLAAPATAVMLHAHRPLHFMVTGRVWVKPPGHPATPAHAQIEVLLGADSRSAGWLVERIRTGPRGRFEMFRRSAEYWLRVQLTRRPYCHTTAVAVDGPMRLRIVVPTDREQPCRGG